MQMDSLSDRARKVDKADIGYADNHSGLRRTCFHLGSTVHPATALISISEVRQLATTVEWIVRVQVRVCMFVHCNFLSIIWCVALNVHFLHTSMTPQHCPLVLPIVSAISSSLFQSIPLVQTRFILVCKLIGPFT